MKEQKGIKEMETKKKTEKKWRVNGCKKIQRREEKRKGEKCVSSRQDGKGEEHMRKRGGSRSREVIKGEE